VTTPLQTNRDDEADTYLAARKAIGDATPADHQASAEHRKRRADADRKHLDAHRANMAGHDHYE